MLIMYYRLYRSPRRNYYRYKYFTNKKRQESLHDLLVRRGRSVCHYFITCVLILVLYNGSARYEYHFILAVEFATTVLTCNIKVPMGISLQTISILNSNCYNYLNIGGRIYRGYQYCI